PAAVPARPPAALPPRRPAAAGGRSRIGRAARRRRLRRGLEGADGFRLLGGPQILSRPGRPGAVAARGGPALPAAGSGPASGHAGMVALLHTYLAAAPPCLEYEYVEGGDLAGLIQEWHRPPAPPGPVIVERATRLLRDLAEIMAFAHRLKPPIVHRDLKPAPAA